MQHEKRLQIWIEQGNVTISQLFFNSYKRLGMQDVDAMLVLHMLSFQEQQKRFPTPAEFEERMHITANEVSATIQRLMQFGFLKIIQSEDDRGVIFEEFSLMPLWDRLLDLAVMEEMKIETKEEQLSEGQVFQLFEQEFGRFLSPMECESISMWLDEDGHSPAIIRAALKEAVLAEKLSLRYIDRILFEWKKKNVKSLADVERQSKKFREIGNRTTVVQDKPMVRPVPFYNWLEERE